MEEEFRKIEAFRTRNIILIMLLSISFLTTPDFLYYEPQHIINYVVIKKYILRVEKIHLIVIIL